MSLDKAIEHGKEHRKPYRRAKAVDKACRNHGSCPWCRGNRLHKHHKQEPIEADLAGLNDELKEISRKLDIVLLRPITPTPTPTPISPSYSIHPTMPYWDWIY